MQYEQLNHSQDNEEKEKEKDQCMICFEYFEKEILKDHQSKCNNFNDEKYLEGCQHFFGQTSNLESVFFSGIKIQEQKKNTTQNQFSLNFQKPKIEAVDLLQSVIKQNQKQLIQTESPLQQYKNQQNIQQIEQKQQIKQEFNKQEEQLNYTEIQPQNQKSEQKIQQEQQKSIQIQEVKKEQSLKKGNLIQYRINEENQKKFDQLYSFKHNTYLPTYIGQNQNQIKKKEIEIEQPIKNEQPIKSEQTVKQLNSDQEQIKLQEMRQESQKQIENQIFQSLQKKNEKNNKDFIQRHSHTPNKILEQQTQTEREQKKQQNQQSNNQVKNIASFNQQGQSNYKPQQKETNKKDDKNLNQWKPRQQFQPIPRQRQDDKKKTMQEDKQFQDHTPVQKKKFVYKPGMRLTDREVGKLTKEELYEYFTQLDLEEQVGFQSKIFLIDNKKIQINENKQCCVCLEEIQPSKEPIDIKLDCEHFFHYDCIKQWLLLHKNCPVCKGEVELVQ